MAKYVLAANDKKIADRLRKIIARKIEENKLPENKDQNIELLSLSMAVINWLRIDPVYYAKDIHDTIDHLMNRVYKFKHMSRIHDGMWF